MKIPLILITIVILLIVGIRSVLLFSRRDAQKTVRIPATSPTVTANAQTSVTPTPTGTTALNPVSLPALTQKQMIGSDFTIGRVLEDNAAYTRYYITYKSGDLTISGIMNKPEGDGPFPVLILNHGYIDPAVYTNGRGLKREQDYLARRGYIVIHPDYRNHAESSKDPDEDINFRLGYIEDVVSAVDAVMKSNLTYFNKEKIGMLGHSMGGGVTLGVLITRPELVKAAVLFAPVSASAKDNYDKYTVTRPERAEQVTKLFGTPETNPDFWKNVSAETFLDKIQAPIMIHHGDKDDSTPIEWSNKLNVKLKELNKEVTYHTYQGQPHEFTSAWPTVMQRTVEFFNSKLK